MRESKPFGKRRISFKEELDQVIKEHDHACDDMRYFVNTVAGNRLLKGLIRKGGSNDD